MPEPTPRPRRSAPEEDGATALPRPRPTGRDVLRALLRPSRGQLVSALILGLTALLVVTTLRYRTDSPSYANLRRSDLIQLLDNLSAETRRLESEVRDLQTTREKLASGAEGAQAARAEAQKRVDQLEIVAGTVPAHGPGVRIVIQDPEHKLTAEVLLDALEELRDAGAEVIEFNDAVRVVASTWIGPDAQGGILVDGQPVEAPITLDVIGDPATLDAGARFRGGLVSEIEGSRIGGSVRIEQLPDVRIDSVAKVRENEFARPK